MTEQNSDNRGLSEFPARVLEVLKAIQEDVKLNNLMFDLSLHNPQDILRQLGVLESETVELATAITTHDPVELFDGIGDCVYVIGSIKQLEPVLWNQFHAVRESLHILHLALCGLRKDSWLEVMTDSAKEAMSNNLTKYDTSLGDAEATQAAYVAQGIKTHITQLSENMFIVQASVTDPAKDVVEGKVLKSTTRHVKPDFANIAEQFEVNWEAMYG